MKLKLADLSHGPEWMIWAVAAILAVISIILISGHGSWIISGYNTMRKEEKIKYDEKKLCRTVGAGIGVITILIFIMKLFEDVLPAGFASISPGIILADVVLIIIIGGTMCRK